MLPPGIPHSPRRPANTIGLVIEQKRPADVKDGLVWHCENCGEKVYEDSFSMKNIEDDLKNVFEDFFASEEKRTCGNCGVVLGKPS